MAFLRFSRFYRHKFHVIIVHATPATQNGVCNYEYNIATCRRQKAVQCIDNIFAGYCDVVFPRNADWSLHLGSDFRHPACNNSHDGYNCDKQRQKNQRFQNAAFVMPQKKPVAADQTCKKRCKQYFLFTAKPYPPAFLRREFPIAASCFLLTYSDKSITPLLKSIALSALLFYDKNTGLSICNTAAPSKHRGGALE